MHIVAEAVKKFYGNTEILKGVDLELHPKEFLGIIGPNGSGKTTFLKCVYRVMKPSDGKIFFDDQLLDNLSHKESALKLAVVAQRNNFNFDFTVIDTVLMGRSPHKKMLERDNGEDYRIAKEALEIVGLGDASNRMLATLSGGEQQRVMLARAIAQQSECLVLDEPTNHLDITYQLEILDIVKSFNLTVLSALHDLNMAAMYSDRLIAFKNGEIVGMGTPRELLTEEFIYNLYGVHSEVYYDSKRDLMNIMYLPKKYRIGL